MKFSELKYSKIDYKKVCKEMNSIVDSIESSNDAKTQIELVYKLDKLYNNVVSNIRLSSIRHDLNMKDKYYLNQVNFNIVNQQELFIILKRYYKIILCSPFVNELKKEFGNFYFEKIQIKSRIYKEELKELYIEEGLLVKTYNQLMANAIIKIKNTNYNLSEVTHLKSNENREFRMQVFHAEKKFVLEKEKELQEIYSELLYIRHKIAISSGYENYINYSYDALGRSGYNHKEVKIFRENIIQYVIPVLNNYQAIQKNNLEVDELYSYDLPCLFIDGDAKINGTNQDVLNNLKYMFEELSPQSKKFIHDVIDSQMLDLESKNNKRLGGYCTYLPNIESPFIFCNFTGGSSDIRVLAHEAGHAFQMYESLHVQKISDNVMPSLEACEVHSKSMELILLDWALLFFGNDAKKYKFSQMIRCLTTMVDCCLIDEFQEAIYLNNITDANERNSIWYQLKTKYKTANVHTDKKLDLYPKWLLVPHIFNTPFYYIDYALAQTCALQFWKNFKVKPFKAWENMLPFYQNGGSMNFLNLIENVGINSPFIDATVINAANIIKDELINYN